MGTLSLNHSITSSHRDDFYSSEGIDDYSRYWIAIKNVYTNYFSNSSCPASEFRIHSRIAETGEWKEVGSCSTSYYYAPCYQYCHYPDYLVRYWNFNDINDPDNRKYIDKIAVTYLGLRAESFVNRCFVTVHAKDNLNNNLKDVEVYRNGETVYVTDINGECKFTIFSSGGKYIDITGILSGYKCISGCQNYEIREALPSLDIDIVLTEHIPDIIINPSFENPIGSEWIYEEDDTLNRLYGERTSSWSTDGSWSYKLYSIVAPYPYNWCSLKQNIIIKHNCLKFNIKTEGDANNAATAKLYFGDVILWSEVINTSLSEHPVSINVSSYINQTDNLKLMLDFNLGIGVSDTYVLFDNFKNIDDAFCEPLSCNLIVT